ncbi:bifunctional transcriptional activator/DNA repair enzyme AdaA [Evansella tamaricis]|uniref:Helix-turn-helix domain-containing protein n=1 Tax=Evansella tamaricis TaxID=2069301 RepID=A0ABS6JA37_9BACI|nr:Ada metal-binding domain-containing protein [Evansella tamaricis]MBU9710547.1 helix-turn-helix domain-containing protein [Evansella tamaricis]
MNSTHNLGFEIMWQAVISCDSKYDGLFFYAVKTTKIFCRPSCKSKAPNPKNISFFITPLEAEREGYRACKRCQPQLDGISYDPHVKVTEEVISILTKNYDKKLSLDELALEVGISGYHLNRIFKEKVGFTPRMYVEKIRMDKSKALLLSTPATNTEVCYQVGYESLSSFYKAFQKHVGCSPKEYRKNKKES